MTVINGSIAEDLYPVAIYVYLGWEEWEKIMVRLRRVGCHVVPSHESPRASTWPQSSLTPGIQIAIGYDCGFDDFLSHSANNIRPNLQHWPWHHGILLFLDLKTAFYKETQV